MSTTDTRAAFEAWAELTTAQKEGTLHDAVGWYYFDDITNDRWEAWQAATEAAKATGTAPKLTDLIDSKGNPKIAPVQGYAPGIPWSLHLEAYDAYCKRYGKHDALIDLEGRDCRGGFGTGELDMFIPGWRDKVSEIGQLKARVAELESAARQPAPVDDNDAFKEAYMIWSRKTDWVQEQISSFPPSALGKHRADVMREEIERLRTALAATAAPVLPRDLRIEIGRFLTDLGECAVIGARMTIGEDRVKELKTIMQTILSVTRSQP